MIFSFIFLKKNKMDSMLFNNKHELISTGNFSKVYKINNQILKIETEDNRSNIKIKDQFMLNLIQEDKNNKAAKLNLAPHIHKTELINERVYTLMDHVPGKTFVEFIKESSDDDIWKMLIRVFSSLYNLHKNVGYHGDLNPKNIIIEEKTGNIKFIDFTKRFNYNTLYDYIQFFYYFGASSFNSRIVSMATSMAITFLIHELWGDTINDKLLTDFIDNFIEKYVNYIAKKREPIELEWLIFNRIIMIINDTDEYCSKNLSLKNETTEKFRKRDDHLFELFKKYSKLDERIFLSDLKDYAYNGTF